MFENSILMLWRLCGILKALNIGLSIAERFCDGGFSSVDALLKQKIDIEAKKQRINKNNFIITESLVTTSYSLLEYFNRGKLALAGYKFNTKDSLGNTIFQIIENSYLARKNLDSTLNPFLSNPKTQLNKLDDMKLQTENNSFKRSLTTDELNLEKLKSNIQFSILKL